MKILKTVFLFAEMICVVHSHITRLPECNKFGATFIVKKLRLRKDIEDNVSYLKKINNVENKERCSALCIENPKCVSAIYRTTDDKKCILYDRKFDESALEKSNSVYYLTTDDRNDDVLVSENWRHLEFTFLFVQSREII